MGGVQLIYHSRVFCYQLLLLLPCAYVVSSMELSGNQDLLCPRDAPSLLTLQSLPQYQLSIGLLQPFFFWYLSLV
jgi:hypothetical protein